MNGKQYRHPAYHEYHCESVQEFMAILQDLSTQSGRTRGDNWMWRGVGDGDRHRLVASALRPESWKELVETRNLDLEPEEKLTYQADAERHRSFIEWASISLFYRHANQQALPMPSLPSSLHGQLIRRTDESIFVGSYEFLNAGNCPPPELWPMMALAQHYGVKTRLLDWSRSPFIAAYFAAKSAVMLSDAERLAVWRIGSGVLDYTQLRSPPKVRGAVDPRCRIHIVDAPYSGNPNLAAQSGRFTLLSVDKDHPDLNSAAPLEEAIRYIRNSFKNDQSAKVFMGDETNPVLVKVSLATSRGAHLLQSLHNLGFDASRLFPGFHGCAEAIHEGRLIDTLLNEDRQRQG